MNTYPPCPLCGCYIDDDHTIDGVPVCGSCHEDETYLRAQTIRTSDGYTFHLITSGENKGRYTDGDLIVTKCHYCNGIADPDEGWHVEGNLTCNGCHDEQLHYLHHGEE